MKKKVNLKLEKEENSLRKRIKVHDSIFKELLDDKEDFRDFILDFSQYDLEEKDLEIQNKEYRTRLGLRTKYIDILYKIKGEESFIIVEHQSTINYKMSEKMSEYCLAVVESRDKYLKRSRNREVPVILPYVLNTSTKKWDAPRTMKQNKNNFYKFPVLHYPKYNVIDINDYTIDELVEKKTSVALAMAFEKAKNIKECLYILEKLKSRKINKKEEKTIKLMTEYIDVVMLAKTKEFTKEDIKEIKEIIREILNGKGDLVVSNFEKLLLKTRRQNAQRAKREGKKDTIFKAVKKMLNKNVKDEDIMDYMDITKEELEKLKLKMV